MTALGRVGALPVEPEVLRRALRVGRGWRSQGRRRRGRRSQSRPEPLPGRCWLSRRTERDRTPITRAGPPDCPEARAHLRGGDAPLIPPAPAHGSGIPEGSPRNLLPPPPAFAAGPFANTGPLLLRGGPGSDAPGVC